MIMPEYAEKLAIEYCQKNGILVINGTIPEEKKSEVQDHVKAMLEIVKRRTREQENAIRGISFVDIEKAIPIINQYESPLEEFMARGLERNNLIIHFKPQFQIGKYRVDLACEKAMLVIECDGHAYHFTEKSQIERDQKRDKYIARKGWRILHFEGIAIRRNIDFCIDKVKEAITPFLEVAA